MYFLFYLKRTLEFPRDNAESEDGGAVTKVNNQWLQEANFALAQLREEIMNLIIEFHSQN